MVFLPANLILLCGALMGAEQSLDAFRYADDGELQDAWVVSGGTPDVRMASDARGRGMAVSAPFGTDADLQRTIVDRHVELDLSVPRRFSLQVLVDRPDACAQVSLYFRSAGGWYSGSGRLTQGGENRLVFPRSDFRVEGQPAGWDKIDGIRLSFWRTGEMDANIRVVELKAAWNRLALIDPSEGDGIDASELASVRSVADRVAALTEELGLPCDRVSTDELAHGALGRRSVAIVAYHPRLNEEATEALTRFVDNGGKLFVCYSLPSRLGQALGFGRGQYYRQQREGDFAELRFDPATQNAVAGLPSAVRQGSWNIVDPEPLSEDAKRVGQWFDDEGNPTGHAAMAISPRGVFFSHILLDDDRESKRQLLAAILGHLDPALWRQMVEAELERVDSIGHLNGIAALKDWIEQAGGQEAHAILDSGIQLHRQIEADFAAAEGKPDAAARFAKIVSQARQTRQLLVKAYLLAQSSPATEGRAVWNHSGTGAYDGDWERSAKELAAAGFNMVIPNMLWAGRAHYASDVLPRSRTFEQHGDQIEQCVAACKRHGIEVHVWKVNWNLSGAPKPFVEQMRQAKRTQVDVHGEPLNWLCPSHPENQKLELDSLLEVAKKYDVDGLHFDYIRYPHGDSCYCDGCRERFEAAIGCKIADWPADCYRGDQADRYRDWRCEQITRLVESVHREAKAIKPEIKISAAVFGAYPDCRRSVGQDWPAWIRAGYLDFVCPMDYTGSDERFQELVKNQLQLVAGRIPVYPGIGATASRVTLSDDRVVGQIHHARALGAQGFTIFNFHAATARDILPGVGLGAGQRLARPPHR